MPQQRVINKVLAVLKQLQKQLTKPANIHLVKTFRSHKIPLDYSKIVLEMGILIRIDGGSRGPSSYIWNKEVSPDKEMCINIINAYNKLRRDQTTMREFGKVKISNEDHLLEIKGMLKTILKILKPIK